MTSSWVFFFKLATLKKWRVLKKQVFEWVKNHPENGCKNFVAWVNLRRILECGWRILVIGQKRKVMRVNEWFWHMHIYNQKTLPGFIMVIIFSSLVLKPKMVYQERFLLSVQFSALAKIWAKINDVQSEAKNSWSWWSKNDWWLTWPPFWRPLLCTFMTFAWKFINYLVGQLDN